MALLEVEQLSFSYNSRPFIQGLDLSLHEGGVLALLGPNGSGKTTLLKLLLGLLVPGRGVIRFKGEDTRSISHREMARRLAYVPQVHRETFGYRVFDVVLMGRMPHTSFFVPYDANDRRIAWESLEKLTIAHLAERPYTEISGGERQLTLIARALAQEVGTFIMDEPTSGLDYGNQIRLLERIERLAHEGYTFLFTTHHPDHALAIADRAVMMNAGTIIYDGAPSSIITPQNLAELYGLNERLLTDQGGGGFGMPRLRKDTAPIPMARRNGS
jgi:iron complex transport system ATP-binding protein